MKQSIDGPLRGQGEPEYKDPYLLIYKEIALKVCFPHWYPKMLRVLQDKPLSKMTDLAPGAIMAQHTWFEMRTLNSTRFPASGQGSLTGAPLRACREVEMHVRRNQGGEILYVVNLNLGAGTETLNNADSNSKPHMLPIVPYDL